MTTLKHIIKLVVPKALFVRMKQNYRKILVLREAAIDAGRHIKYAAVEDDLFSGGTSSRHLECQLTKDYHRIEKGLALKQPKRPFGESVRGRIKLGLENPAVRDESSEVVAHAESALEALEKWNSQGLLPDSVSPAVRAQSIWEPILQSDAQVLLTHFFTSRRSVRSFDTSKLVDETELRLAAASALTTPSVCNRQAWRLHIFTQPDDVSRIIRHQNGNAGFGNGVPTLAIATVDTRLFAGAAERHQRWIDGGLFAMNFAHGLHARGLATCMLNWSMKNDATNRLREAADIPLHEDVVMLMAIGYTEEEFRVARSPRRSLDKVLVLH